MQTTKYLIIGGSTKCGTTSVFHYFEFHPDVCACRMKESRFFWTNEYPLEAASRDHQKVASFDELFENCHPDKLRLEATPDYLYSSTTAKKIKSELPQCKIVFILRDPIDRLVSWYKFARLNGLITKECTLEEYISNQQKNTPDELPQHMRSLQQGKYFSFLKEYIDCFGKENVLITFYEDMAKDPHHYCSNICDFAGINNHYFSGYDFKVFNKSVATRSVGAHKLFRKFKRSIRPMTRLLHNSLRKKLKLAGYNFEKAYISANSNGENDQLVVNPATSAMLNKYYREDVQQLASYMKKTPPWKNFETR